MSLHIVSHPWEVTAVADGTLVNLTPRDLDVETVSILADELCELALESGPPTLYLDFAQVHNLPCVLAGKLCALDRRLREAGGRLVLLNLAPEIPEECEAELEPDDTLLA
jgi:anti-anti-sigma regulatory factor